MELELRLQIQLHFSISNKPYSVIFLWLSLSEYSLLVIRAVKSVRFPNEPVENI